MTLYVKVIVRGEPENPPFTRVFAYCDRDDEHILFNAIERIKEKLDRRLKINTNEALMVYVCHVVDQLRGKKSISSIKENALKVLSSDQVMIGVPETLGEISFEVVLDHLAKVKFSVVKPIVMATISNDYYNNNISQTQESAGIDPIASSSAGVILTANYTVTGISHTSSYKISSHPCSSSSQADNHHHVNFD